MQGSGTRSLSRPNLPFVLSEAEAPSRPCSNPFVLSEVEAPRTPLTSKPRHESIPPAPAPPYTPAMQHEMFAQPLAPERAPPVQPRPLTADDVRARMVALIDTLRGADAMPLPAAELKRHVAMFPIMAQWLDPADGEALLRAFEAEVARLDAPA